MVHLIHFYLGCINPCWIKEFSSFKKQQQQNILILNFWRVVYICMALWFRQQGVFCVAFPALIKLWGKRKPLVPWSQKPLSSLFTCCLKHLWDLIISTKGRGFWIQMNTTKDVYHLWKVMLCELVNEIFRHCCFPSQPQRLSRAEERHIPQSRSGRRDRAHSSVVYETGWPLSARYVCSNHVKP